jgi:hypothetical protein
MNAQNDNTAPNGLPPRSGIRRLIRPIVYRHLRGFGTAHIAAGIVQAAAGVICLWYGAHPWAAFFLVIAALNFAGGTWYLTINRSAAAPA